MWSKITLRMRITVLTALALSLVAGGITALSIYNAGQIFFEPRRLLLDEPVEVFILPADARGLLFDDLENLQMLVIEQRLFFSRYSTAIAALFVLLGTAAAYVISGQVLKPIKALAEKMEDIDANNLSQPLELPKSKDEVSRLTHSFNNMLGELNRSFETQKFFAQNAAHELKTPLASMRANIEVLELDLEPTAAEYKEVVGVVKDNTERLIGLVDGLLSLNSTSDEAAWQTLELREIFEKILHELQDDIAEKHLSASIIGDCRIQGDKGLLERAFSNLIHNSVRYNAENGEIRISLSGDTITIEDSGMGIEPKHLPHVFEAFYCADQSRSKMLGGHGLGLSIAKCIFDKHHINVKITSEFGKGTKLFLSNKFS